MRRRAAVAAFLLPAALALWPGVARARDHGWHQIEVPGGQATLRRLGAVDTRERALVMIDLIRRLHFSTGPQVEFENALNALRVNVPAGESLSIPSPLPPAAWWGLIAHRRAPAGHLFLEILADPNARLLFHGLSAVDPATRRWIADRPDTLQRLYRNDSAVRAFAMFAPAFRVESGTVQVAGGVDSAARWSAVVGAPPHSPDRFLTSLFEHHAGRTAGLYFLSAIVDQPRRQFLLGADRRALARLVSAFAECYPSHSTDYPFAVRSHDAALLLLEVRLDSNGAVAGPRGRAFWQSVFEGTAFEQAGDRRRADAAAIDAAWITQSLCRASSHDRRMVFETLLAGQRVFEGESQDAVVALRGRRFYPAIFMALEHARLRGPHTYAALARHAGLLARVDDPERAITATRLFQGALVLTLNALSAGSLTITRAEGLLESLAALPFDNERYDGGVADWLEQQWLPEVRSANPALARAGTERAVAAALGGPPAAVPQRVLWDGEQYVIDHSGMMARRLLAVRQQQGGVTLDAIVDLNARRRSREPIDARALPSPLAQPPAVEYEADGPDVGLALRDPDRQGRVVDYLLAHALAAWAYAPRVGEADSGALVAGDGSLRHMFGVRLGGRARREQRWQLAPVSTRGSVGGALLGLEAPLSHWSLKRLSADALPPPRAIGGNDLMALMLSVSLSDARRLSDDDLSAIATAAATGAAHVQAARTNLRQLGELAATVQMSPWRLEALRWMITAESERVVDQFSIADHVRLGGLSLQSMDAWGSANIVSGCLCLAFAPPYVPEIMLGRAADGNVGGQSADLMLQIAIILADLKMPAALAPAVLAYAMRDFLDQVAPHHPADYEAFQRQARTIVRRQVEDYLGAIATVGPLRPLIVQ